MRVSVAGYNNCREIDQLIGALAAIHQGKTKPQPAEAPGQLSLESLQQLKGWQQRYRQLMKWADSMGAKPQIRTGRNRVGGCESATWLSHRHHNGRHQFSVDSEARVVKGLAALLLILINNKTTEEISAVDLQSVFSGLGLEKHLSRSRNNGFRALVDRALELVNSQENC